MALVELIYHSRAAEPLEETAIAELALSAAARNDELRLTGFLAAADGWFLQVLEGDRATVSELYHRIAVDPRHRELTLMRVRPIHARRFDRWNMGVAGESALERSLLLRHGATEHFDPASMSAASAHALLEALAARAATADRPGQSGSEPSGGR